MAVETVVAAKADLGREVRRDTPGRRMEEEADTRGNKRKVRAWGPLSPLAGPLVFANCLEDVSWRYPRG